MPSGSENEAPQPRFILLRIREQRLVAIAVAIPLIVLAVQWGLRGIRQGRLIEIDRAAPRRTEFQVNLNEAAWPEITLLPGIGETLARDIVAQREADGAYADLDDLAQRVDRIGPSVLERIKPYVVIEVHSDSHGRETRDPHDRDS